MDAGGIGAWPDRARVAPRGVACAAPGELEAFPSGRAALLACLARLGVGPDDVIGTPEAVTDCVTNAVRRVARPLSVRAALARGQLNVAIVYEQWGWPLSPAGLDDVDHRLSGVPVIADRVDSADFFSSRRGFGAYEVLSLSKTLGQAAGGLARRSAAGDYLQFKSADAPPVPPSGLLGHPAVRERFKQSQTVHPAVGAWLAANCPAEAAEYERRARNRTARAVLDSPLSAAWPAWLAGALDAGAGPVWAPILRGSPPEVHWRVIASLARAGSIAAAVRPFNWSGNPLAPRFEPCVALPIHSGVDPDVVAALA